MPDLMQPDGWLPLVFGAIMALAMLIYVVLDGYDLGVGILLRGVDETQQDTMIASIGPFWDANETWLVLGVGVLLTAFPLAHGVILTSLYLPVMLMLLGLIVRGVAFDFRVKARAHHKVAWTRAFFGGSLLASFAQGLMLGLYITGFGGDGWSWLFAVFVGLALVAGYMLLGATWLIMKTGGELQARSIRWARGALWLTGLGIAAVSLVTPWVSSRVFDRWFSWPEMALLAPIPLATAALFIWLEWLLRRLPRGHARGSERWSGAPFIGVVTVFLLAFAGLAYSLFPYVIPDRMDLWDAAAASESLMFLLVGIVIVLPAILGYTVFAYRVFWGKAEDLTYY